MHSAAKWRFLKIRRSEHDSMLPSPGEVKAAPTRPLGRRYAASRPRNDAVQSPFGGGRTRVRGRGGADRVEYDATVYPQELSDAASVWFLRRRNAPARLRYTPRPKPIRVAWRLPPPWRSWSMTNDCCAVLVIRALPGRSVDPRSDDPLCGGMRKDLCPGPCL